MRAEMRAFLKPRFIQSWNAIRKEGGYRLLIRKKGWHILVVFILFYLVRDSIMYLLIPYLAVKGFLTCG
jgi:hypothetical protein